MGAGETAKRSAKAVARVAERGVGLPPEFADVAEAFVDSAKALVSKARAWNREALEQLSHALGQIETSLRDGGLKARAAS